VTWRVVLTHGAKTQTKPYLEALASVGLEGVCVSPGKPGGLEDARGLVLAGGTDVNPERYGQPCAPETHPPFDDERDKLEMALLSDALSRNLPVLAICRGIQLLNVHLGGTLLQHIDGHKLTHHPIRVAARCRLRRITRLAEYQVISRHHQAVNRLAGPLKAVAWSAKDGIVEAVELPGAKFVVGVQWHPEDCYLTNEPDDLLFAAFRKAAARR